MVRFAGVLQEIEARGHFKYTCPEGKSTLSIWNSMDAAERKVAELLELKFCERKQTGLRTERHFVAVFWKMQPH